MPEIAWFNQASPGGVLATKATFDVVPPGGTPTQVLVVTEGGLIYRRRRDGSAWRWERVGTPPGSSAVAGVASIVADSSGTPAPVAIADLDLQVWRGGEDATSWVQLGRPEPNSWEVVARSSQDATGLRHLVVLVNDFHAPWVRQGLDPDGTWFSIAPDAEWDVVELSLASASPAPGDGPAPHIFALTRGPDGFETSLRVAVRQHSVWTWVDPGPRPDGADIAGLSSTSIRDSAGVMKAVALVGRSTFDSSGSDTAMMLTGAGTAWQWQDVGKPPGDTELRSAVVAVKGPDPVAGEEPVVVARTGHHLWRWNRSGGWVDFGTVAGDVTVVDPDSVFDTATPAGRRLWLAGVGWDAHMWTATVDGATAQWEDHGFASTVTSVVGAYTDPQDPEVIGRMAHQCVIDEAGHLWASSQGEPFNPWWEEQGQPTPSVACAAGVGALTIGGFGAQRTWAFVLGNDGHLWARAPVPSGGSWVDHGMPPNRRVRAALPPLAVGMTEEPCVPVLADDGQLWFRTATGPAWLWESRGAPPGHLIFTAVGAGALGPDQSRRPVVAVVADDGHVWLDAPQGGGSAWVELGAPSPTEKLAAGVGVDVVSSAPASVGVFAVGTPSGHVWSRGWAPGGGGGWADLGSPNGQRIHGAVGVMADPRAAGGRLVLVIGNDRQLWAHTGAPGASWEAWGFPRDESPLNSGRAVVLDMLQPAPIAMMSSVDRRLWLATPRDDA